MEDRLSPFIEKVRVLGGLGGDTERVTRAHPTMSPVGGGLREAAQSTARRASSRHTCLLLPDFSGGHTSSSTVATASS